MKTLLAALFAALACLLSSCEVVTNPDGSTSRRVDPTLRQVGVDTAVAVGGALKDRAVDEIRGRKVLAQK